MRVSYCNDWIKCWVKLCLNYLILFFFNHISLEKKTVISWFTKRINFFLWFSLHKFGYNCSKWTRRAISFTILRKNIRVTPLWQTNRYTILHMNPKLGKITKYTYSVPIHQVRSFSFLTVVEFFSCLVEFKILFEKFEPFEHYKNNSILSCTCSTIGGEYFQDTLQLQFLRYTEHVYTYKTLGRSPKHPSHPSVCGGSRSNDHCVYMATLNDDSVLVRRRNHCELVKIWDIVRQSVLYHNTVTYSEGFWRFKHPLPWNLSSVMHANNP